MANDIDSTRSILHRALQTVKWVESIQTQKGTWLAYRAMTKSSRTMREPSPMYFCTSSLPDTRMKVQSVWCATARASSVFPVPGGPYSSTPCRHAAKYVSATSKQLMLWS